MWRWETKRGKLGFSAFVLAKETQELPSMPNKKREKHGGDEAKQQSDG
jgi:hypothetical protein